MTPETTASCWSDAATETCFDWRALQAGAGRAMRLTLRALSPCFDGQHSLPRDAAPPGLGKRMRTLRRSTQAGAGASVSDHLRLLQSRGAGAVAPADGRKRPRGSPVLEMMARRSAR